MTRGVDTTGFTLIMTYMRNNEQTTALYHLPAGRPGIIAKVCGQSDCFVRAQAMGLREGKSVEVLRRNGRMILVQVGATRLAISSDLAQSVEVR